MNVMEIVMIRQTDDEDSRQKQNLLDNQHNTRETKQHKGTRQGKDKARQNKT
jgi:hypothetical protein